MADAPKLMQDEFSLEHGGCAIFRLVWAGKLSTGDKADLLDWLKLVERRIQRMPEFAATDGEAEYASWCWFDPHGVRVTSPPDRERGE